MAYYTTFGHFQAFLSLWRLKIDYKQLMIVNSNYQSVLKLIYTTNRSKTYLKTIFYHIFWLFFPKIDGLWRNLVAKLYKNQYSWPYKLFCLSLGCQRLKKSQKCPKLVKVAILKGYFQCHGALYSKILFLDITEQTQKFILPCSFF